MPVLLEVLRRLMRPCTRSEPCAMRRLKASPASSRGSIDYWNGYAIAYLRGKVVGKHGTSIRPPQYDVTR